NISTARVAAVPTLNTTGEGGLTVTAGLGSLQGTKQFVFIEKQTNPIDNHSVVKLSDSLALDALLDRVSPGVDISQITAILKASSNLNSKSLESVVAAIADIVGASGGPLESRD